MKIIFLSDYLGRETAMKQYRKGDVADFPTAQALELIRLEVAEEVEEMEDTQPVILRQTRKPKTKDGGE